jgi:DNA-binding response OmpR family regulator
MPEERLTALGSARERFVRGLPDRGRELCNLSRQLQAEPTDVPLVDHIGRRLHALYASAQVFQDASLTELVRSALAGLEAAQGDRRPPTPGEIDGVFALGEELAASAGYDAQGLGEAASPAPRGVSDAPVAVPHSVAGTLASPEVIAVLAIARAGVEDDVRAALSDERCELTTSGDVETALAVLEQVSPDVVLVETTLLGDDPAAIVAKLRGGRGASARTIVALVPEGATDIEALLGRTHADSVLRLPLARADLLDRLQRWSGRGVRSSLGLEVLNAGTVEEIARGIAEEIRRGIAGSLRQGRGVRIELGDKSDLLAATWSAVARVREGLSARADGRLRFDEAPFSGGPSALALTEREPGPPHVALEAALQGRRILLADDDPAVLWFFGNLLREAGAVAIEARDGRRALELARSRTPDVVVSDILMPEIDGFTLCRELRRDLMLAHVPVILLSWKEDFLQRMRELESGAAGYLRKEAGAQQILATIAGALRPQAELAALLAEAGEVQGRVESIGVPALLSTVAAQRPDARVSVRDAWNLFEVDIRSGSTLAVTRTASDGTFARGQLALRQLLGVESGRFTVMPAHGAVRYAFAEPIDALISEGLRQLGAALDAVSDRRLPRVHRVTFDDEVLGSLLTATPTALVDVAARLRSGAAASDLLSSNWIAARELEQHLRELARRGALLGVFGPDGEDLIAAARVARDQTPGALLHTGERVAKVSTRPVNVADAEFEHGDSRPPSGSRAFAPHAEEEPFAVQSRLLRSPLPEPASREPEPGSEPPPVSQVGDVPARRREPARTGFALLVIALAASAFAGVRWMYQRPATAAPPRAELPAVSRQDTPSFVALAPSSPPAEPAPGSLPEPDSTYGRLLPFIDRSRGVPVTDEEGLLIIEHPGANGAPRVKIGGRDLGRAPIAVALPEGRHEIVLKRDERTSFRFVVIRPGHTRLVELGE